MTSTAWWTIFSPSLTKTSSKSVDVNASVSIGEVNVSPDGEAKGGFFRDFRKQYPNGQYRLRAHVTTGKIVLLGMSAHDAAKPE